MQYMICMESRSRTGTRSLFCGKTRNLFHNIFEIIRNAKELICLEFYIFRNDETGNELAEILKRKASEGVKVYILYDHFGSLFTPAKFWAGLTKAGVHIRASHPFQMDETFPLRPPGP